ncbi:MAG: TetR/AcrR family transcriptional regulator [Minicystis sp.]
MQSPTPPQKARTRERQREDTRQRIYDAAMEIFRRDGFEAARVDDVAKAAGVSHGTFYFHFATKDEVLIQCLRASEIRVVAAIGEVPLDAGLVPALETTCAMIAREWEGDPQIFRDVGLVALRYLFKGEVNHITAVLGGASAPSTSPPSPQSLTSVALVSRFQTAAERGEVTRLLPPQVLADLFLMNVFAATLSWCAAPAGRPLGLILAGVVRLFLDGARGQLI